jgi:uncharacterized protein YdeI (YjbR/CyaY-like superfamily)
MKRNDAVAAYLKNLEHWGREIRTLRQIVLENPLDEELKWGKPCYSHQGRNVVLLIPFKACCAVLFCKGALLKDPNGVLIRPTENTQAARQFRFSSLKDIQEKEPILRRLLQEALAVEKAGLEIKYKDISEHPVPLELQARLDQSPALKKAFAALTAGRRRSYLMHVGAAKQAATREARVEKCIPAILKGLGFNERPKAK